LKDAQRGKKAEATKARLRAIWKRRKGECDESSSKIRIRYSCQGPDFPVSWKADLI
jgi:hypothetical protein